MTIFHRFLVFGKQQKLWNTGTRMVGHLFQNYSIDRSIDRSEYGLLITSFANTWRQIQILYFNLVLWRYVNRVPKRP